jgi:hypothetical protein
MRALVLIAAVLATGLTLAEPPDLKTLTECSDRAWEQDIGSWANYAFDRHVTRRSLDKNDKVTFTQKMRFRVTPSAEGFDEVLVEIDGRKPTDKEVKEHREKAHFAKHYGQAEKLELENPLGENLALMPILQDQEYRIVGEEEVNGIPCIRAVFDAKPEVSGKGVREQLASAIKGSACFSVDGCHLVFYEMETVRQLKEFPITVKNLRLKFEGQPVDHDGWLLGKVELQSHVSVMGKDLRKSNSYGYSDFKYRSAR